MKLATKAVKKSLGLIFHTADRKKYKNMGVKCGFQLVDNTGNYIGNPIIGLPPCGTDFPSIHILPEIAVLDGESINLWNLPIDDDESGNSVDLRVISGFINKNGEFMTRDETQTYIDADGELNHPLQSEDLEGMGRDELELARSL